MGPGDGERTVEELFERFPEGLELYMSVVRAAEDIGEAALRVTKSQIALRRGKGFAYV